MLSEAQTCRLRLQCYDLVINTHVDFLFCCWRVVAKDPKFATSRKRFERRYVLTVKLCTLFQRFIYGFITALKRWWIDLQLNELLLRGEVAQHISASIEIFCQVFQKSSVYHSVPKLAARWLCVVWFVQINLHSDHELIALPQEDEVASSGVQHNPARFQSATKHEDWPDRSHSISCVPAGGQLQRHEAFVPWLAAWFCID